MAGPVKWFRKNKKKSLAILTILTVLSFVFLPVMLEILSLRGGTPDPPVVTTKKYGNLREREISQMLSQRGHWNGFVQGLRQLVLAHGGKDIGNLSLRDSEEDVVQTWLLSRKAREMGITISQETINRFLSQWAQNRVSSNEIGNLAKSFNLSPSQLFDILGSELSAIRARGILRAYLGDMTPAQRWDYFLRLKRSARIEAVPINVEKLIAQVPDPTAAEEKELKALFEKYKEKRPDSFSPEPGFRELHQIIVQYFKADMKTFLNPRQVTDEEILKYYNDHKEDKYTRLASQDFIKVPPSTTIPKSETPSPKQIPSPKSEIPNPKSEIPNPKSEIPNPKSEIPNPKSEIPNPKSEIPNPKSEIPNPKAETPNPKSEIPNPKSEIPNPKSEIPNPKSGIPNPKSEIPNLKSEIPSPKSQVPNPKSETPQGPPNKTGSPEKTPPKTSASETREPAPLRLVSFQEDRGQKAEGRGQKAEGRGQKAEGSGQNAAEPKPTAPKPEPTAVQAAPAAAKPTAPKPEIAKPNSETPKPDSQVPSPKAQGPSPKSQVPSPKSQGPSPTAKPEAPPRPRFEVIPLEKVKDEIRGFLAKEKAKERMLKALDAVQKAMADFDQDQWMPYDQLPKKEKQTRTPPEPPLEDLARIAKANRLAAGCTGWISELDARQWDIGNSRIEGGTPFTERAFSQVRLYQIMTSDDSDGNQYVFWKLDDYPERIPQWGDPGVRDRVVYAWKLDKARDLAARRRRASSPRPASPRNRSKRSSPSGRT